MSLSHRTWLLLILGLSPFAGAQSADAETRVRVAETHPSSSATLGRNQAFYVRIDYATDESIRLWARPFRNGVEVPARSNPSALYTGSGEALGWFELMEPGAVDEIRIRAGGGEPYREWEVARNPVQLRWTNAASPAATSVRWVEELQAIEAERAREEAQQRADEPVAAGDMFFFNGFMLLMAGLGLAGIVVSLRAFWQWRGVWKILAAIPAAAIAFVVLRIIIDTARDPTSHNLWPFEIVMFSTAALVGIGALKVLRRFLEVEV